MESKKGFEYDNKVGDRLPVPPAESSEIKTGGGAFVKENVRVENGNFTGRDRIIWKINDPKIYFSGSLILAVLTIVCLGVVGVVAVLQSNSPNSEIKNETFNDLYIFTQGTLDNTYIIKGENIFNYTIGDGLVVYGEIVPNTEVVIALLKVIAKNPDSLAAQEILVNPSFSIRTNLRVDGNLSFLSKSELVPASDIALGYFLQPGVVRLRPNSGINTNVVLEALNFVEIDETQLDTLSFDPPILMRVIKVGQERSVASVKLISGSWPVTGTIVTVYTDNKTFDK